MEPLEDFKKYPAQQTEVAPPEGPIEDLPKNPDKQASQASSSVESGAANGATAIQEESVYKSTVNKIIDFNRWFITVVEIALIIRFFFRLLGADPTNPSVGFLYALTDVILL